MIFPKPADLVVSASYNPLHLPLRSGVLHVRAEAWAGDDEDARNIADKLNAFLAMFHSAETSVGSPGSDEDVKAFFSSLQVRQENNRAVLYAALPTGLFHKVLSEQPPPMPPAGPAPSAQPSKTK